MSATSPRRIAPARPILVVEDDAPIREMIEEMLTADGYSVITAADGVQASLCVAQTLPELVVLDLQLPKMSGLELLAEWRANPRTADLPVFVLTCKDLTKEEEKYIHAHAEFLFLKQNSWREPLLKQLECILAPQVLEDACSQHTLSVTRVKRISGKFVEKQSLL